MGAWALAGMEFCPHYINDSQTLQCLWVAVAGEVRDSLEPITIRPYLMAPIQCLSPAVR
jgi:hypothetical protein